MYNKELYRRRKEQKVCTRCGVQDERTLAGKSRCLACALMMRQETPQRVARREAARKIRTRARLEQKQCVVCGCQDERTLTGKTRCTTCENRHRASKQASQDRLKKRDLLLQESRRKEGLCQRCGARDRAVREGSPLCFRCRGIQWRKNRERRLSREKARQEGGTGKAGGETPGT